MPIFTLHDAETHSRCGRTECSSSTHGRNALFLNLVAPSVRHEVLSRLCGSQTLSGTSVHSKSSVASTEAHRVVVVRDVVLAGQHNCHGSEHALPGTISNECQESKKSAKTIDLCQNPLTKDCREEVKRCAGIGYDGVPRSFDCNTERSARRQEPKIVMAKRIISEWQTPPPRQLLKFNLRNMVSPKVRTTYESPHVCYQVPVTSLSIRDVKDGVLCARSLLRVQKALLNNCFVVGRCFHASFRREFGATPGSTTKCSIFRLAFPSQTLREKT